MKTKKQKIEIVGIILISFILGVLLTQILSNKKSLHEETHLDKETTWTCAMHPQIKLPTSGDCPICGMDLIPLEKGDNSTGVADFTMSDYSKSLAQMETTTVILESPRYEQLFLGEIEWNEKSIKTQSAWFGGRIEKLHISYLGQAVRRGAAVATIYSPELFSAAEEWRQAENSDSEPLKRSVTRKLKLLGLSNKEIKNLGSVKSELFVQRATVNGVVTKLSVSEGGYVKRGGALITVANTSKLWTQIELYEKDLDIIEVGDEVEIVIPNSFTKVLGKIVFIDPTVSKKKRTTRARVEINNRDGLLKPGMLVEARVSKEVKGEEVLVPASSLLFTGIRAILYISIDGGYEPREVEVGRRYGELYSVNGVTPGEVVVTRGAFKIDAARQIMALPSMMYPDGDAPDPMAGMDHGADKEMSKNESNSSSKKMPTKLTSTEKKWLNSVYNSYLALQKSLRDDDLKNSITLSQKMMTLLMKPLNKFSSKEQNSVMMELHKINDKSTIKDLRSYFLLLSNWLIKTTETYKFSPESGGSVFFCPMANNNKGAEWIQLEKEVLNPYWGEMMIGCGEVRRPVGVKNGE
jgi:Cu(I)/Ag(I) efflux system membrane fusion protein